MATFNMAQNPGKDILSKVSLWNSSSGRSSISLNSLLSEYLTEMQQLAEGTLLQPPAEKAEESPPVS